MITEEDVEKAVAYLRDTAEEAAQAKADRVYLEEFRKSLKSQLFNQAPEKLPIAAKEAWAYDHDDYRAHLGGLKEAIYRDEKLRFLRKAAEARIEAWRSLNANHRAIRV